MELKGKVVFITGGVGGLGKAFCQAFLERGSKVCLGDVVGAKGDDVVKDFGDQFGHQNVIYVHCDVTKQEDYEAAFQTCKEKLGEIDIMINNAGIFMESDPNKTLEVNLFGTLRGSELVMKRMGRHHGGRGGNIVNIASSSAIFPFLFGPFYAASKGGILQYTRSIGHDFHFAYSGVKIQCLCPSFVDTEIGVNSGETRYNDYVMPLLIDVKDFFSKMKPPEVAVALMKLLDEGKNGAALFVEFGKPSYYVEPPGQSNQIISFLNNAIEKFIYRIWAFFRL